MRVWTGLDYFNVKFDKGHFKISRWVQVLKIIVLEPGILLTSSVIVNFTI